ncbi:MAG: helix-turn-helix transcriptional regulator [Pseudomonadota bacterium]
MSERAMPPTREAALATLRMAMNEKKLTQAELASEADCHEKTVQNLFAGRSVRDQTLFDVCMVLGLEFEPLKAQWKGLAYDADAGHAVAAIAPLHMGGYTRDAVDHFVGSYLTVRPAFADDGRIIAYRTDIFWSDIATSLAFKELDRPDAAFSHRGHVYVPASASFIHLVSLTKGAMRMVLLSQLDQTQRMRGIITTLNKAMGMAFIPVSTPIVYAKCETFEGVAFGEVAPGDEAYASYRRMLDETMAQSYARLVV